MYFKFLLDVEVKTITSQTEETNYNEKKSAKKVLKPTNIGARKLL